MLNNDYSDMLRALSHENVEFMVVGGYALSAHGYPRTTLDIDIWVKTSSENAAALMRALKLFGAPLLDISADDFMKEDIIFQIGVAPRRIDILTSIDGVQFPDAYRRSVTMRWDDIDIKIIALEDLIANKTASGRYQDLADVEVLKRLRKGEREGTTSDSILDADTSEIGDGDDFAEKTRVSEAN